MLLNCLLKFNEVYKLISGDSKFGLKLNAFKKDIISESGKAENETPKQRPIK